MTVNELYNALNDIIPPSLSCDWDNDGKMCVPDGEKQVKSVLLTLDVTEGAVKEAVTNCCDVIISHHPLIFKPLKGVCDNRIVELIKNGISAFSFHTRLDRAEGGVNTALACALGLKQLRRFGEDELGVIGNLECPMTDCDFAEFAKQVLGAPCAYGVLRGGMVKTVALVGGSGDDYIDAARESGADLYLSGELGYNDLTDASEFDMSVLALGHFYTENPVLSRLGSMIKNIDACISVKHYSCNVIEIL